MKCELEQQCSAFQFGLLLDAALVNAAGILCIVRHQLWSAFRRHVHVNLLNVDMKLSPRVQTPFSLCTICVVANALNCKLIRTFQQVWTLRIEFLG